MLFAPDEAVRYFGCERSNALIAVLQLMGGMFILKEGQPRTLSLAEYFRVP